MRSFIHLFIHSFGTAGRSPCIHDNKNNTIKTSKKEKKRQIQKELIQTDVHFIICFSKLKKIKNTLLAPI